MKQKYIGFVFLLSLWSCKSREAIETPQEDARVEFFKPALQPAPLVDEGGFANQDSKENKSEDDDRLEKNQETQDPLVGGDLKDDSKAADDSKGTGGPKGMIMNGLRYTHEGVTSQYRVWAPEENSPTSSHPLVVYLHGDTGSNFGPGSLDSRISSEYFAFGQANPTLDQAFVESDGEEMWRSSVFVSVLTPSYNGSFLTWITGLNKEEAVRNADFLEGLVQEKILKQYNIDQSEVYFVGQSGGAIFLSGVFLPKYGYKYKGGAIMLCGGDSPMFGLSFEKREEFKNNMRVHFETTKSEIPSLVPRIKNAFDFYSEISNNPRHVLFQDKGEGDHCLFGFSQPTIIAAVIRFMRSNR